MSKSEKQSTHGEIQTGSFLRESEMEWRRRPPARKVKSKGLELQAAISRLRAPARPL